jgi:hypothetical protein
MANDVKKCAHPACDCEVEPGTKYCSAYCRDAGDTTEISCNCGHARCTEREGVPTLTAGG